MLQIWWCLYERSEMEASTVFTRLKAQGLYFVLAIFLSKIYPRKSHPRLKAHGLIVGNPSKIRLNFVCHITLHIYCQCTY